ncbi:MAG: LamG-like jellyroll fold domain-containing protein [Candidatus Methanoperedens sp.]
MKNTRNREFMMHTIALCFLAALLLAGTALGEVSRDGLVGEWLFDGDAKDTSGNGNDGTIYGASFVDGKFGKALSFDGVNDYVDVPRSNNLDINGKLLTDYTIELWFKTSCQNCGIFSITQGSSTPPSPAHDRHIYLNNGNLCQRIWNNQVICTSGTNYADSNWHHVAQHVQKGIGQKIYVDGVQKVAGTKDISDFNWADKIWIGYSGDASSGYFNGLIDEVRIYNRALSADEIKASYEGEQTALSITKSASPTSIKQGQTATITLSVKNTGTTEIKDIEIKDTLPSDVTYVSGETSKTYSSLAPKDSREFQYIVQINQAGTFNLNPAAATFADVNGNYFSAKSNTAAINVIASIAGTSVPTYAPTSVATSAAATTSLAVKKEASPYSIRQYQTTTVSIKITNSGTSDIKDIEIIDAIKPNFDLISGDFPNPKKYNSLSAGESRELQYILKPKESGNFNLGAVTVSYSDERGNIKVISSESVSLTVVPSPQGDGESIPAAQTSKTASVNLHGEKTDVVMGEDILLRLSAVNLITKPKMHVQVIIIPPSGMSVTSSEFSKSAAGQFTTNYQLEPGDGKDIEVRIRSNQVGDFNVNGRIIYYFGDEKEKAEDQTLNLPIKVRKEAGQTESSETGENNVGTASKTPGFSGEFALFGILFVVLLIKKRR